MRTLTGWWLITECFSWMVPDIHLQCSISNYAIFSLQSEPNKTLSTQNQYFPFHISHSDIQQKRPISLLNSHWGCNLLIAPFNFNTHLCCGLFPLMIIMAFLQSVTQRVKRSTVPLYHCGTKKCINQRQTVQSVSSWCHIWLNVCEYKGALMQNTSKY